MKEIKFRAWDGNEMVSDQLFSLSMNGDLSVCRGSAGTKDVDYPLMQFTGLRDKNGVDIYEGDIVIYSHGAISSNLPPQHKGEVRWHDKYCKFVTSCEECLDFIWSDIEVIGNIHKNPELLNQ